MQGSLDMAMSNLSKARMNLFKTDTGLFSYKMCEVEFEYESEDAENQNMEDESE